MTVPFSQTTILMTHQLALNEITHPNLSLDMRLKQHILSPK